MDARSNPHFGGENIGDLPDPETSARLERVREVLRLEQLEPVYQPIVELNTGRVIAFEALSRFPGDQAHTADRWFGEAWRMGLGLPLELLAVRLAAPALSRIPPEVGLTINASPPTLADPAFLRCLGGEARRVTVELTEHLDVDSYAELAAALAPLRNAGGKTAIDDLGAGFASLRHILRVSPDWIKLDISLTERVDENSVAHALANALVSFAEDIGIGVIAEGIETVEELDALTEIGVRFGQGFHLGMPAPLEEALAAAH